MVSIDPESHVSMIKIPRQASYCQSSISAGDQIWTRYTTPQLGSSQRVRDLQQTWHFVCGCQRCTDPTELGESGAQPRVSHIILTQEA